MFISSSQEAALDLTGREIGVAGGHQRCWVRPETGDENDAWDLQEGEGELEVRFPSGKQCPQHQSCEGENCASKSHL